MSKRTAARARRRWRARRYLNQPYVRRFTDLLRTTPLRPGEVRQVFCYHDSWCRIYRGGYCNCSPDVVIEPPQGELH